MIMSDRFQLEREFSRWRCSQPTITNHPFRRLHCRLENYNPARSWTMYLNQGTTALPLTDHAAQVATLLEGHHIIPDLYPLLGIVQTIQTM